ncbi:MAG: lipoyl(octanoyl) transferase LipB [Armatimonadota bacterium]|jgi:lipoic acid synthetase|nr:lipoyl(octanoyl) transferase LipB [Armatimonadota bacterium]
MRRCELYNLGRISYTESLELQHHLHSKVAAGDIDAALLLLEHEPVITIGVKGTWANIVADAETLKRRGVDVVTVDRGGDVTFHGPGQLVGYPILNLMHFGLDVHAYLRALEETIIETLAEFGISGYRNPPAGVWVGGRKICSIGIAVRKRVTYHGFALNVNPDMSYFALINPCGLSAGVMTSMAEQLERLPAMDLVRATYVEKFVHVFGYKMDILDDSRC